MTIATTYTSPYAAWRPTRPVSDSLQHAPCHAGGLSEYEVATAENDSIKFYCCEVGTTQTVILRVYQIDVNGVILNGLDGASVIIKKQLSVKRGVVIS